jgi:hypothetical protein
MAGYVLGEEKKFFASTFFIEFETNNFKNQLM